MQDFVGKHIDRYLITERLGMGGMAVVYKAFDTRLERDVALKLIRTTEIPESQHDRLMKRFEREAKAQARFNHRHIVPVHDYGEVDGAPYLVMPYIPGGTLKACTGEPIPYQQAIQWLIPVADALAYAHKRSVIHRDIKPSNILFDEEEQPILTDFGIAKILETNEATLTGTGLGVGTPEYMAPEQWRGKSAPATDQYALGVVLYELLTGQKPYQADTPAAVAIMQATEPFRSPGTLTPGIPEGVEKLLYKMLERDPQDRYADMAACRSVLEEQQINEPVKAPELHKTAAPDPASVQVEPLPIPTSDGETVDELSPTPVEGVTVKSARPVGSNGKHKPALPGWLIWAGGVALLVLFFCVAIALLGGGNRIWLADGLVEPLDEGVALVDAAMPTATDSPAFTITVTTFPSPTATETQVPTHTPTPEPRFLINYINHDYELKQVDVQSGETIKIKDITYDSNQSSPIGGNDPYGWDSWPVSWSREGRYVSYSPRSNVRTSVFSGNGLFIIDTVTAQETVVSDDLGEYIIYGFSPDSKYLLFATKSEDIPGLFIYNIESKKTDLIASWSGTDVWGTQIEWENDTARFYFKTRSSNVIQKYDTETNVLEEISVTSTAWARGLHLSPLGDKLFINGSDELSIVNLETREKLKIESQIPSLSNHLFWIWVDNSEIIGAWHGPVLENGRDEHGVFRIRTDDFSVSYDLAPRFSDFELGVALTSLEFIHRGRHYLFLDFNDDFWPDITFCITFTDPKTLKTENQICGIESRIISITNEKENLFFIGGQELKQLNLDTYVVTTLFQSEDTIYTFSQFLE